MKRLFRKKTIAPAFIASKENLVKMGIFKMLRSYDDVRTLLDNLIEKGYYPYLNTKISETMFTFKEEPYPTKEYHELIVKSIFSIRKGFNRGGLN